MEKPTSGLACKALTKSWEKRTGVSLRGSDELIDESSFQQGGSAYLVKTCSVLDGDVLDCPWPIEGG